MELLSADLGFDLTLPAGQWGVRLRRKALPALEGASFGASWREGGRRYSWLGNMHGARITELDLEAAPERPNRSLSIELERPRGINLILEVSLGLEVAALSWRIHLQNRSGAAIQMDRVEMLRLEGPEADRGAASPLRGLRLQPGPSDLAFFTNGWGSWNVTGALGRRDRFPRTRLGPLTLPMRLGAVGRQPHGRSTFTSEMFGILGDRTSRVGLLLGFLSQTEAFGGLQVKFDRPGPRVRMWAECDGVVVETGGDFSTDWCRLEFIDVDDGDPLGGYFDRVAQVNRARIPGKTPAGWCSWYQFYQAVTEAEVQANLEWAREHRGLVPFDVIQIDDGFAAEVGDWSMMSAGFPSGLTALSRRIRQAEFTPGLWLAPFVAKPRARVLDNHPDWILRDRFGMPANAGFIWDTFARALDVTHPQVVEHVESMVKRAVGEWGFDYLKLDFLYAGALRGVRRDPRKTRAQALRSILERMRAAAGEDVFLVGCGCPLGSGIGIFDAMRISPDVAPTWEPTYRGLGRWLRREPDLPSVRNALHNSITRAPLHRRWWLNDPDCLILRGGLSETQEVALQSMLGDGVAERPGVGKAMAHNPSRLTVEETRTLVTVVALSGGSLFVSDHLPELPDERIELLARLLPPLSGKLRAIDWFDVDRPKRLVLPLHGAAGDWLLVGLINWADEPSDVTVDLSALLPGGPFAHAVDFWKEAYVSLLVEPLEVKEIPPHGSRLLAIRKAAAPQWLGDTLHVSQGLAVSRVRAKRRELQVDLRLGRRADGKAWLELPAPPARASLDGVAVNVSHVEGDVYVCALRFDGTARLAMEW